MGSVALMLLGAAVFLFLTGIGVVRYAQFILSLLVERKHTAAEIIMHSGSVPPRWTRGIGRVAIAAPLAKLRAIRRLRAIIRYFEVSPMVDDEQTRSQILGALKGRLDEWRGRSWSDIRDYKMW